MRPTLLAAVLVLAAAPAARAEGEAPPPAPPPGANPTATTEIDRAACEAWAREFEVLVASGDGAAIEALVDWPALMEPVMKGLDLPEAMQREFQAGLRSTAPVGGAVLRLVQDGGRFRFLRAGSRGGAWTPIFRCITAEGGVAYQEVFLRRDGTGRIRIVDLYAVSMGERMTESVRRLLIQSSLAGPAGVGDRTAGGDAPLREFVTSLQRLSEAVQQGRWRAAMDIYAALPEPMRKERVTLMLRFRAAQGLDDAEQQACLADFQRWFPSDPCLDLLAVDSHVTAGRHKEAIACLDRVDTSVGGDPYLGVLRGNVHLLAGDPVRARISAARAAKEEPTLEEAHWVLVTCSLAEKDFDETARLLIHLRDAMHVEFSDLAEVPEYAEFVKSPAYAKWVRPADR